MDIDKTALLSCEKAYYYNVADLKTQHVPTFKIIKKEELF